MFDDQKADEWTPLKELEALVHEADMLEDALEQFREDQFVAGSASLEFHGGAIELYEPSNK